MRRIDTAAAIAAAAMLAKSELARRLPPTERLWVLRLIVAGLLVTIALSIFSGCTSLPAAVRALGSDTNSISMDVSTPWGSGHFRRNMPAPMQ